MGKSEKKRQKALARRRKREKRQRHRQALRQAAVPRAGGSSAATKALIRNARSFPIHESLISAEWRERGLGQLIFSRPAPDGRIIFGVYLVDALCLGVKNAFCNVAPAAVYERELKRGIEAEDPLVPCDVQFLHQLIYGSIDYARQFGFEPDPDFRLAQHVLEPRDQIPPNPDIEFGREGKPCYISGPNDNVDRIVQTLDQSVGPGGYDFMIGGLPDFGDR